MAKLSQTWTLPARCSISSITLRETDGDDEAIAQIAYAAKRGQGTTFEAELLQTAIVAVNGQPVDQPFTDWRTWSSRTRGFVLAAFQALNSADGREVEAFLAAGAAATATPATSK